MTGEVAAQVHTAPALLGQEALLQDLERADDSHHFRACGLR